MKDFFTALLKPPKFLDFIIHTIKDIIMDNITATINSLTTANIIAFLPIEFKILISLAASPVELKDPANDTLPINKQSVNKRISIFFITSSSFFLINCKKKMSILFKNIDIFYLKSI